MAIVEFATNIAQEGGGVVQFAAGGAVPDVIQKGVGAEIP